MSSDAHVPLYIYNIYTPNLGLEIAILGLEREQGRFKESTEGARGSIEGVRGSTIGQCMGAAVWKPEICLGLSWSC